MIENRHRIEKEILLGRQTVRRSVQSRTPALPQDISQGAIPEPSTLPRISLSLAPLGSDVPLSVDTDAETAYVNGSYPSFKRIRPADTSGVSTPRDSDNAGNQDPLRSPLTRRKWASNLLDVKLSDAEGSENSKRHRVPPVPNHTNPPASPGGFFTRFRTQSFPALTSPFSTIRRSKLLGKQPRRNPSTDHAWSSDSSSDDLTLDDRPSLRALD
jgi:hypothetical protein